MKKTTTTMIALFFLSTCMPLLNADEMTKRLEAMILVKKAVAFLKEKGRNTALEEFSNPNGKFLVKDHYIFAYEVNGKCVAHAANRFMIGKVLIGLENRNSKGSDQAQDTGKNEIGWRYCVFTDPASNATQKKLAYLEKSDDIVIGCGFIY